MTDLRRAREIFDIALGAPESERDAVVIDAAAGDAELEALVHALLRDDAAREPESETPALVDQWIGPGQRYRLIERIGEGGFGVVYRAEQAKPRRDVAIKVIRSTDRRIVARFRLEEQALALMNHPCIAQVFDTGTTADGRSYFVMEFIPGVAITAYCDAQRLTIVERLELFVQVCDAVQHAHQKGVIHRDLKPSNVLVERRDEGSIPKVIDFGIAKAVHDRLTDDTMFTQTGQVIGTPAYMSPEQAQHGAADIDTRADVYALGVLLYELLTGTRPFDSHSGPLDMQRQILEVEPARPSTRLMESGTDPVALARARRLEPGAMHRQLRGDLDWIVLKCLEKVRDRRYASASQLASDVRRYLHGETVSAGPPTRRYVLSKFVRRNRGLVAAAGVISLVLVVATLVSVGFAISARRTADQLTQALSFQQRALEAVRDDPMALVERLRGLISDDTLNADATNLFIAQAVFDPVAETLSEEAYDPEVEGILRLNLARSYFVLGQFRESARQAETAKRLYESIGSREQEYFEAQALRVEALQAVQDIRGEEPFNELEQALAGLRATAGDDATPTLDAAQALAVAYASSAWGSPSPADTRRVAERHYRFAAEGWRRREGPDSPRALDVLADLGVLYRNEQRYDDAEALFIEVRDRLEATIGRENNQWCHAVVVYGELLRLTGRAAEALPVTTEAVRIGRELLGDSHTDVCQYRRFRGRLLGDLERYDDAARELAAAYRCACAHPESQLSRHMAAEQIVLFRTEAAWHESRGALDDAERAWRDAIDASRTGWGELSSHALQATAGWALFLHRGGRFDETVPVLRDVLAAVDDADVSSWVIGEIQSVLGVALIAQGHSAEGERLLLEGVAVLDALMPPSRHGDVWMPAIERLITWYESTGAVDQVRHWRARLGPAPADDAP